VTREALAHADSRRVRLLALLGVVAALVLVRAEASQAAFSFTGGEAAAETAANESTSGEFLCRGGSNLGPCFYVAITVVGGGRVESTADPAGTMVRCPPQDGHGCNVPEWFIWALDVPDPFIDFRGIATTGTWSGWTGPDGLACHAPKAGDPPLPVNGCRLYANDLDDTNYTTCMTATFTGSGTVGGCDEGTPAPVGDPVVVVKQGSGSGTVTSSPAGINCGSTCRAVFELSTMPISLFANPSSGSTFAGWGGVGHSCSGTGACSITVSGQTIRAVATFNLIGPPPPPVRPPLNTVLFQKPAKTTRKRTATFAWGARRSGQPFFNFKSQCRLNGQVWKACAVPKTYRALKPGRIHTVRIRVGYKTQPFKWDTTPVKYSWRVRR
jgi:Divergent InlB B-repeat domain